MLSLQHHSLVFQLKVLNHASRIPALVLNQLWIWLNKLLLLLPSWSCPPSSTSRNTTTRHTDFSVFTSQHLLHCTISLASCLYWACSETIFFSVRLFFKLVYGKRSSVRDACQALTYVCIDILSSRTFVCCGQFLFYLVWSWFEFCVMCG